MPPDHIQWLNPRLNFLNQGTAQLQPDAKSFRSRREPLISWFIRCLGRCGSCLFQMLHKPQPEDYCHTLTINHCQGDMEPTLVIRWAKVSSWLVKLSCESCHIVTLSRSGMQVCPVWTSKEMLPYKIKQREWTGMWISVKNGMLFKNRWESTPLPPCTNSLK